MGILKQISPKAKLGKNIDIGHGVIIYDNVDIGDGTIIEPHCLIGVPVKKKLKDNILKIGKDSHIRSHSVLYEGSKLDNNFSCGHYTLVREMTKTGLSCQIGSHGDIEGYCSLGDYVKCHSYVHIGQFSEIRNFVWIYSLTTLTNDPMPPSKEVQGVFIDDGVVICVGALILPGTTLRKGAFIPANSLVSGEVPTGAVYTNDTSSKISLHVKNLIHIDSGIRHPWMRHFSEKYPPEAQSRIKKLYNEIL